jgi:hypothetical protein
MRSRWLSWNARRESGILISKLLKMKTGRKIYFIIVLLAGFHGTMAQNGGVSLGIKVGYNKPQLRGSDVNSEFPSPTSSWTPNFLIGLSANSRTSKYFWLKHDVFYAQRYMTLQESGNGVTYSSKFKRHYIDIYPISPTFQYKGLQIFAGPYLGILMNASIQRKNSGGQLYDSSFYGNGTQNSNYAQKFDYGYTAGIEYEFPFGVNIGFRYTRGFVPLIEKAVLPPVPQKSIYNNFTTFTIGYSFLRNHKSKGSKPNSAFPMIPPLMAPTGKTAH